MPKKKNPAKFKFGRRSQRNLTTAHSDLKRLFNNVIKHYDCTVLEGHRNKSKQNKAYRDGKSKLKWPKSKHNRKPSLAVDVVPYPIDWKDWKRFYHFGGYVKAVADQIGIKLRWGGDWDRDGELSDNRFNDLPHIELDE